MPAIAMISLASRCACEDASAGDCGGCGGVGGGGGRLLFMFFLLRGGARATITAITTTRGRGYRGNHRGRALRKCPPVRPSITRACGRGTIGIFCLLVPGVPGCPPLSRGQWGTARAARALALLLDVLLALALGLARLLRGRLRIDDREHQLLGRALLHQRLQAGDAGQVALARHAAASRAATSAASSAAGSA